ncbi:MULTISPECIES: hypothetical protein [unclassified Streptomyces]|uniref:hypothetical protein n=1 Tax=unclassified Streptomyces TaxID=2593676 RepID=UPI0033AD6104
MYELSRGSLGTSRLLRDGRFLVVFTSTGDGTVGAEREEPKSGKRVAPHDAAVGYALGAAFGTGAELMWKPTMNALLELWP